MTIVSVFSRRLNSERTPIAYPICNDGQSVEHMDCIRLSSYSAFQICHPLTTSPYMVRSGTNIVPDTVRYRQSDFSRDRRPSLACPIHRPLPFCAARYWSEHIQISTVVLRHSFSCNIVVEDSQTSKSFTFRLLDLMLI